MDIFLIDNLWICWTFLAILFLIIELTSGDLFMICLSVGAVVSSVFALAESSIIIQILAFVVASALSILFLRPKLLKRIHKKGKEKLSNVDAIIGRVGEVSETILAKGYGRVKIDGDYWKAQNITEETIEKGERVKILSQESIIITVEKV